MEIVTIHKAKTTFSSLVERAATGEAIVIAKGKKPMAKLVALDAPTGTEVKRLGFLKGQVEVPDDFDVIGQETIEKLFGGDA